MSESVFCDAFRVLTWTFSTKDESSSSGILSISKSVGNLALGLLAAISDLSRERLRLPHQTYLLKFFGQKSHLFVLLKKPIYHRCKTQKL